MIMKNENKLIEFAKEHYKSPIVKIEHGYVILAQNERDYQTKLKKILRRDTKGFFTLDRLKTIYSLR
jgi:hypothetical protein